MKKETNFYNVFQRSVCLQLPRDVQRSSSSEITNLQVVVKLYGLYVHVLEQFLHAECSGDWDDFTYSK